MRQPKNIWQLDNPFSNNLVSKNLISVSLTNAPGKLHPGNLKFTFGPLFPSLLIACLTPVYCSWCLRLRTPFQICGPNYCSLTKIPWLLTQRRGTLTSQRGTDKKHNNSNDGAIKPVSLLRPHKDLCIFVLQQWFLPLQLLQPGQAAHSLCKWRPKYERSQASEARLTISLVLFWPLAPGSFAMPCPCPHHCLMCCTTSFSNPPVQPHSSTATPCIRRWPEPIRQGQCVYAKW